MLSFPDFKEKTIIVVFPSSNEKFAINNDNLIIKNADDKIIFQTSCYKIFALWIIGHCTITSVLLEKSKKFCFSIYLLNFNFRLIGLWNSATEGNFLLRTLQYNYNSIDIAKHLVKNKLYNQILLLKEIRKKDKKTKDALKNLKNYYNKITEINDINLLRGIEGISSKIYFLIVFYKFNWNGRRPRTKCDPINVLLDIGYTFLFNFIECMLNLYGFDIYKGVYHTNFYKRKSLVCDLQEPFRCIIEKSIVKNLNLGVFKFNDFKKRKNQFYILPEKIKNYTTVLMESIIEYKSEIFFYCQTYYRSFIQNKNIEQYPFFKIKNHKI